MNTETVLDEPALRRPKIIRWFGDRPRIADVLVILACTAPTVTALILAPPVHAWLGYICAMGVAIAFWWRRSHPLVVLLVVVGFAALNPVSSQGTAVAFFESLFAVYSLAAHSRLRIVLLGYLMGEAVIFAVSGIAILLGFREGFPVVLLQPGALVALALGIAVRVNHSRRTAIEELVTMREEQAAAAERARITAEMHDVVAHSVTVMIALAGGARVGWQKHPERARNALEQLGAVGAQALEEMQRILRVLRDNDGDLDKALEASGYNLPPLEELIDLFRAAGLPVRMMCDQSAIPVDPALQTTVYRIVQESLTNTLRHARGVTYVEVEIARHNNQLVVSVTDNGQGGSPAPSIGAGVGLRAMRERAAAFHGRLDAGPIPTSDEAPGTGWRTRVSLPLREIEPA